VIDTDRWATRLRHRTPTRRVTIGIVALGLVAGGCGDGARAPDGAGSDRPASTSEPPAATVDGDRRGDRGSAGTKLTFLGVRIGPSRQP
jgi:hypothetical protein